MRVVVKILGSERSGSSCRATQREHVLHGNMSKILLTIAEAATTLRLHPVTLRALAAAGEIPAFKLGVPLNNEAMALLQEEKGKHRERVFTFKGRPLGQVNTTSWRNALKRAEIENFRWHDLRHVWAISSQQLQS
jgi:integrase